MAEFYISTEGETEGTWNEPTDIQKSYEGLKVGKVSGLDNYGAVKNIYTESYPESDELRVYIPQKVTRENTDIEFEISFSGNKRRDTYHSFVNFVSGKKLKYYDTERMRECVMVLVDAVEIDKEEFYGTSPFMTVSFKFKNLNGSTTKKQQ